MVSPTDNGNGENTFELKAVDDFLTMPQVVTAINHSRPMVLRLLQSKKLLGYKDGDRWKVKKSEVRRFLEQGNHPDWDKEKDA